MTLPYENTTSGKRAIDEIQKIMQCFGVKKFGHMMHFEANELEVFFEHRDHSVRVKASAKGYAAAWLREHPYTHRTRLSKEKHEAKALKIGQTAIYSVLRDWIKGQITAVETGILSFEGAFLGQILLPSGKTILEHTSDQKLLPAIKEIS